MHNFYKETNKKYINIYRYSATIRRSNPFLTLMSPTTLALSLFYTFLPKAKGVSVVPLCRWREKW